MILSIVLMSFTLTDTRMQMCWMKPCLQ